MNGRKPVHTMWTPWALTAVSLMAGCAGIGKADLTAQRIDVEGQTYVISQLTASTWTAIAPASRNTATATPSNRALLLQAIERQSGCKVTDADYSRNGAQLDAQVDCASRLKN